MLKSSLLIIFSLCLISFASSQGCSSQGQQCGKNANPCCQDRGLICYHNNGDVDGYGTCLATPNLAVETIQMNVCAFIGDECGNPQEGKLLCCPGMRCKVKNSNSFLGAVGHCQSIND